MDPAARHGGGSGNSTPAAPTSHREQQQASENGLGRLQGDRPRPSTAQRPWQAASPKDVSARRRSSHHGNDDRRTAPGSAQRPWSDAKGQPGGKAAADRVDDCSRRHSGEYDRPPGNGFDHPARSRSGEVDRRERPSDRRPASAGAPQHAAEPNPHQLVTSPGSLELRLSGRGAQPRLLQPAHGSERHKANGISAAGRPRERGGARERDADGSWRSEPYDRDRPRSGSRHDTGGERRRHDGQHEGRQPDSRRPNSGRDGRAASGHDRQHSDRHADQREDRDNRRGQEPDRRHHPNSRHSERSRERDTAGRRAHDSGARGSGSGSGDRLPPPSRPSDRAGQDAERPRNRWHPEAGAGGRSGEERRSAQAGGSAAERRQPDSRSTSPVGDRGPPQQLLARRRGRRPAGMAAAAPTPPLADTTPDPVANNLCVKCGRTGHWSRKCPNVAVLKAAASTDDSNLHDSSSLESDSPLARGPPPRRSNASANPVANPPPSAAATSLPAGRAAAAPPLAASAAGTPGSTSTRRQPAAIAAPAAEPHRSMAARRQPAAIATPARWPQPSASASTQAGKPERQSLRQASVAQPPTPKAAVPQAALGRDRPSLPGQPELPSTAQHATQTTVQTQPPRQLAPPSEPVAAPLPPPPRPSRWGASSIVQPRPHPSVRPGMAPPVWLRPTPVGPPTAIPAGAPWGGMRHPIQQPQPGPFTTGFQQSGSSGLPPPQRLLGSSAGAGRLLDTAGPPAASPPALQHNRVSSQPDATAAPTMILPAVVRAAGSMAAPLGLALQPAAPTGFLAPPNSPARWDTPQPQAVGAAAGEPAQPTAASAPASPPAAPDGSSTAAAAAPADSLPATLLARHSAAFGASAAVTVADFEVGLGYVWEAWPEQSVSMTAVSTCTLPASREPLLSREAASPGSCTHPAGE